MLNAAVDAKRVRMNGSCALEFCAMIEMRVDEALL